MPRMEKADAIEAMLSEMRCAAPTAEEHAASQQRIVSLNRQLDALYTAFVTMEREKDAVIRTLDAKWQPIETAPTGGLIVLLADFRHGCAHHYVGHFAFKTDGRKHWVTIPGAWVRNPTHWMPLPSAPQP